MGRVEQGFAQAVGAQTRLFGGVGGGGARILGRGAHLLQGAARLFHQGVARLGRQGLEAVEGELGGGIEAVGLALRHVDESAELVGGRLDQIAHGLDRGLGGAIQIARGAARDGKMFDQLSALAFDLGRKILLIGAQGVGGGDQGGALLAEAFFDGLDLLSDARTCVLKSNGLARQIVGGHAGGVLGFTSGGGEVGGASGKGSLRFTKLRLSQVRGVSDHARLPLDRVDDA